jgi:hypothetical protein
MSKKLIAELVHALRFYADPRRYAGPNQPANPGDPYTPTGSPYMVDVKRDGGAIARQALRLQS